MNVICGWSSCAISAWGSMWRRGDAIVGPRPHKSTISVAVARIICIFTAAAAAFVWILFTDKQIELHHAFIFTYNTPLYRCSGLHLYSTRYKRWTEQKKRVTPVAPARNYYFPGRLMFWTNRFFPLTRHLPSFPFFPLLLPLHCYYCVRRVLLNANVSIVKSSVSSNNFGRRG